VEILTLVLLIMVAVLISSVLSRFIPRVSTPLVQIGLGIAWYFTPFLPNIVLDSDLFIVLFIAPLLYLEARNIDRTRLAHSLGPAMSLAVGLVLATMVASGFLLHALWPLVPLSAAFALGAALGPTDAVSVAQIGKEAQLSDRQYSILQGESLFNDAVSIVGFQTAVAAGMTGVFSPLDFTGDVVKSFVFGIIIGTVVGLAFNWLFLLLRRTGLETMTTRISMELFLPFCSYALAEEAGVSGILAVVATGLVLTYQNRGTGSDVARTNLVSNSVWQFLEFTLNGSVFVLLGMELPIVMRSSFDSKEVSLLALIGIVILLVALSMILRFIWVAAMLRLSRDTVTHQRRHMSASRWKSAAIMTFGGPKGAISLALILTIPYAIDNGQPLSIRNSLLFITAGFITVSLILANLMLPLLAPRDDDSRGTDYINAQIEVIRRTIAQITKLEDASNHAAMRQILRSYNDRVERIKQNQTRERITQVNKLRLQALEWEESWLSEIPDDDPDADLAAVILERLDASLLRLRQTSDKKVHMGVRLSAFRHRLRRILKPLMRRTWKTVVHHTPGHLTRLSPSADAVARARRFRDLYTRLYKNTLQLLSAELHETHYPPEVVSEVMVEYRASLASLQPEAAATTSFAQFNEQYSELRGHAFRIELDTIHEMVENEELTRYQARMLRSNVYVMQADASLDTMSGATEH
jgi:CPA1 family monovalent cation:H+ antiporter